MSKYCDRQGNPLTLTQWAAALKDNSVEKTELPNGRLVSTVWLGLDHGFGGRPLWFETMVFAKRGDGCELDCDRYETEDEAREGHRRMVEKWSADGAADPRRI